MDPKPQSNADAMKRRGKQAARNNGLPWAAGVAGIWAGFVSMAALLAALLSSNWALVKEPIVIEESHQMDYFAPKVGVPSEYYEQADIRNSLNLKPVETSVIFRLGLWNACPSINSTGIRSMTMQPPCSTIPYIQSTVSYTELFLPAPAPLAQSVIARLRISTPFMVLSCIFLTFGSLLALISRYCYNKVAIFSALFFTLGGISVGVGVVWFISVISEEFGVMSGRRGVAPGAYGYWYSWSLGAAGISSIGALIAALLIGQAHISRHVTHISTALPLEDTLHRPLLRCRSDGYLSARSFTSDTLRTYLNSDYRRTPQKMLSCDHSFQESPSVIDLTRPSGHAHQNCLNSIKSPKLSSSLENTDEEGIQSVQLHHPHQPSVKNSQNHYDNPVGNSNSDLSHTKIQYHYRHPQIIPTCVSSLPMDGVSDLPVTTSDSTRAFRLIPTSSGTNSPSSSTCSSSAAVVNSHVQSSYHTHQKHCPHHSQTFHQYQVPIISQKEDDFPMGCPPPPLHTFKTNQNRTIPPGSSTLVRQSSYSSTGNKMVISSSSRAYACEPPRIPEFNTFRNDFSKTLPSNARQMALLERSGNTSGNQTNSTSPTKISSEV